MKSESLPRIESTKSGNVDMQNTNQDNNGSSRRFVQSPCD